MDPAPARSIHGMLRKSSQYDLETLKQLIFMTILIMMGLVWRQVARLNGEVRSLALEAKALRNATSHTAVSSSLYSI
jgi:hypothetical protein